MRRSVLGLLLITASCYVQDPAGPSTFPTPTPYYGPPGGYADFEPYPATTSADGDSQGLFAQVTDEEIEMTLESYGEWVEDEDYGRVWRPYPTVVGVDFTPYETCGTWVWTEYGWTFTCEWDWGWLPFHYGQWEYFDDGYWGWVADYQWSPAWCDWRDGDDYIGWRPKAPVVRDHRGTRIPNRTPIVRDHRSKRGSDIHWRFARHEDFGKRSIRSHLFKNPAEALSTTSLVTQVPFRGHSRPGRAADFMRQRFAATPVAPPTRGSRGFFDPQQAGWRQPGRASTPTPGRNDGTWGGAGTRGHAPVEQPTWMGSRGARPTTDAATRAGSQPSSPWDDATPSNSIQSSPPDRFTAPEPVYTPPSHVTPDAVTTQPPTYQPPTYQPPSRFGGRNDAPTYTPPTYQPPRPEPSRYEPPRYNPPPRPEPPRSEPSRYNPPPRPEPSRYEPPRYNPPPRPEPSRYEPPRYNPPPRPEPSHSNPPPSRSYEAPSRSSSSSSSHSYSPPASSSSSSRSSSSSSSGGWGGGARRH